MTERFTLIILTPDRVVVEAEVDRVMLPAMDGILEVTPGRWPLITALSVDDVVWYEDGNANRAAIGGGIAVFADGRLNILTSDAIHEASRDQLFQLRTRRQAELETMLELPIFRTADSLEPALEEIDQPLA